MKPFRFGVGIGHVGSRAELADKAKKIEALGYDTLNFPDHLTDRIAPMPALVSAAEATQHLRVGTNVLNNDLRHPVLVAREAWGAIPDEGARALQPVLVACDDLGYPGDVDYADDLPEGLRDGEGER